jgi:hypothetical protein
MAIVIVLLGVAGLGQLARGVWQLANMIPQRNEDMVL